MKNGAVLVEVRSPKEFAGGSAPRSTINIPLKELELRLHEIPMTSPVVLGCASGSRSRMAELLLMKNGYPQLHNAGSGTTPVS
jgi:rhodanese-related sulfurtransferase